MPTITIEDKVEMEEIIKQCSICMLGIVDEMGFPYVFPMNFGYEDGVVYLHSSCEGSAITALRKNSNVCVTFCTPSELAYRNEEVACTYHVKACSVIARGQVKFLSNFDDKVQALNILMKHHSERTFKYSHPAVNNVLVWKIVLVDMSGKKFGVASPHAINRDS